MYYTEVKFKLSDAQKKKFMSAVRTDKPVTIRMNQNAVNKGDDVLYLTKTQLNKLSKPGNHDITFSITQLRNQRGGFLGALLPLAKTFLPTIAKSVIAPLGMAAATGAISGGVSKAIQGSGVKLHVTRKQYDDCCNHLAKLVDSSENTQLGSGFGAFLAPLLGSLIPSFLGNGLYKHGQQSGNGLYKHNHRGGSIGDVVEVFLDKLHLKKLVDSIGNLVKNNVITKTLFNKAKDGIRKQNGGFLPMLLGTLGATLLPSLFGKGLYKHGSSIIPINKGPFTDPELTNPYYRKKKIFETIW